MQNILICTFCYLYRLPLDAVFSLVFSTAGKRTLITGKELLVNLSCFLVLPYAGQILFYKNFFWSYYRLFIHPKKKLYKIFFQCLMWLNII